METIRHPQEYTAMKEHQCNYCLGTIPKGSVYEKGVYKYDGVYSWKSHILCNNIASKLKMFDYADDGVTQEFFEESIREEYRQIWREKDNDYYESKEFVYPPFHEQLEFVIEHHG